MTASVARLGEDSVLSVEDAARELRMFGSLEEARAWLRAQRLVRPVPGAADAEFVRWGDVLARLCRSDTVPLRSWTEVARFLGVSVDTLQRRRRAKSDTTQPFFANGDAARTWYRELEAPSAEASAETPKRRPRKQTSTKSQGRKRVDWREEARR